MKSVIILLALLSGCEGFRATTKAGFERMAAARLKVCVQGNPCQFTHQCFSDSDAYCLDAGYDKACGQMEPEGSCGVEVK